MTELSDQALDHLRDLIEEPELADNRYEIVGVLGRGGMGTIFKARDTLLRREVALKVLNLSAQAQHLDVRLQREAQVLARLEHPGIVAVYDAGTLADGRAFYVMRLVHGQRFDEFAASNPSLGELARHFLRVCEAVAFANESGVVHRDLKPANIMIGPLGEVLVLDWGVAKLHGLLEGDESAVLGTPGFMAPEQASGKSGAVDERADVYGLGAILRELLHGASPPAPRPLLSIATRATYADPAGRYPSARALADDIRRWMDGQPVLAHVETTAEKMVRLYRRHQAAILLLLGYALVRAAILLFRGI